MLVKEIIWNLTIPVQFSPPRPGKGQIQHPGKALPVNLPTPQAQKIIKCSRFPKGGGGGVSIRSAHNLTKSKRKHDTLHNLYFKIFSKKSKAFKNDFGYVLIIVIDWIPGKNRFICSRSKALLLSLCFHGKLKNYLQPTSSVIRSLDYGKQSIYFFSFDTQLSGLLKVGLL